MIIIALHNCNGSIADATKLINSFLAYASMYKYEVAFSSLL